MSDFLPIIGLAFSVGLLAQGFWDYRRGYVVLGLVMGMLGTGMLLAIFFSAGIGV